MTRAWCAVAALGLIASCAMQSSPKAAQAVQGDPRAEIEALDRQITDELARAGVAPPTSATCGGATCAQAMATPFATPTQAEPSCRPAPSDRCRDACTLASSICDNQAKLCALAQQLTGDEWAANRCASARNSCQAAHAQCCGCAL